MTEDDVIPTPARLVRDFVNTYEPQTGAEALASANDLHAWLTCHVPAAPHEVTDDDLAVALDIREGLRAVLLAHGGHDVAPDVAHDLDNALQRVPVRLSLSAEGQRLLPAGDSALARALAPVIDAVRACAEDQTWQRLKACSRETCRWAYFDLSRNQSRRWCSMAGCGNYTKMRRRALAT